MERSSSPLSNPFASDSRAHRSSLSHPRIPRLVYWTSLVTNRPESQPPISLPSNSLPSRCLVLRNSTPSYRIETRWEKFRNRRTRSTVADNRQNRIATGFPLFSRPARRIFRRRVVQIPRDADSRNPRVSTRSMSIEREKKRKEENWKSVKKGSWSPRRWSKSCASLEELARSEEGRG